MNRLSNIKSIFKIVGLLFANQFLFAQKPNKSTKEVQVVLLGGQSNMGGHGDFDKLDDTFKQRIKAVQARVTLSIDGKTPIPLSYYTSKSDGKFDFTKSFGPELFIGLTLGEKYPDKEFLLIKTSHGGTALYGAWNPEWTAEKAKAIEKGEFKQNLKLYTEHLNSIHKNIEMLKEGGKSYQIFGMAWMQGENDAATEVSANSYQENLLKLINCYRTEFKVPNMPFVIGQINSRYGEFKDGPKVVRQAMENVANADKNVGIIKTSTDTSWNDFPKHSDNVHYNQEGQKRLGIAMANEMILLNNKK